MRKFLAVSLLLIAVAVAGFERGEEGVRLEVATDKKIYKVGEWINIRIALVNRGKTPVLVIPSLAAGYETVVELKDSSGRITVSQGFTIIPKYTGRELAERVKSRLLLLNPGASYAEEGPFLAAGSSGTSPVVLPRGAVKIRARYVGSTIGWMSTEECEAMSSDPDVLCSELDSNEAEIRVR